MKRAQSSRGAARGTSPSPVLIAAKATKFPVIAASDELGGVGLDQGLSVGCCTQQGKRPYQEDEACIRPGLATKSGICPETHLFALFDGHAGGRCSKFVSTAFPDILAEESSFATNLPQALKRTFHLANDQFLKMAEKMKLHDGSTGLVTVIREGKIVIGNVGDCRALIMSGGRPIQMSVDQKPTDPEEQKRIAALGGIVVNCMGVARVNGVLAVSRAFGNRSLKSVIRPDAEITIRELCREDDFLVIASDGLWDVLRNKDVSDVCYSLASYGSQHMAEELVHTALIRGSMDNVTCIVVRLGAYVQRWLSRPATSGGGGGGGGSQKMDSYSDSHNNLTGDYNTRQTAAQDSASSGHRPTLQVTITNKTTAQQSRHSVENIDSNNNNTAPVPTSSNWFGNGGGTFTPIITKPPTSGQQQTISMFNSNSNNSAATVAMSQQGTPRHSVPALPSEDDDLTYVGQSSQGLYAHPNLGMTTQQTMNNVRAQQNSANSPYGNQAQNNANKLMSQYGLQKLGGKLSVQIPVAASNSVPINGNSGFMAPMTSPIQMSNKRPQSVGSFRSAASRTGSMPSVHNNGNGNSSNNMSAMMMSMGGGGGNNSSAGGAGRLFSATMPVGGQHGDQGQVHMAASPLMNSTTGMGGIAGPGVGGLFRSIHSPISMIVDKDNAKAAASGNGPAGAAAGGGAGGPMSSLFMSSGGGNNMSGGNNSYNGAGYANSGNNNINNSYAAAMNGHRRPVNPH